MSTKHKNQFEYQGITYRGIRLQPAERYPQIMSAYAALSIGDCPSHQGTPHYLTVGHAQIAETLGISHGTVFSYLRTVDELRAELRKWAAWAFNNGNQETQAVARKLLIQIASVEPDVLDELGLTLTLAGAAE